MQINDERVLARLKALARIGGLPHAGVRRLAFSNEDLEGRNWVSSRLEALGLDVRIDALGNLFGVLPGSDEQAPGIMFGSHTDTVGRAGRLDGLAARAPAHPGIVCKRGRCPVHARHDGQPVSCRQSDP